MEDLEKQEEKLEDKIKVASLDELARLSDSEEERVRQEVAVNGNLSAELFRKLAMDKSPVVRASLPVNNKITQDILMILANDSEWETRWAVANSNNARRQVLELLIKDEVEEVRESAKEHLDYIEQNNLDITH